MTINSKRRILHEKQWKPLFLNNPFLFIKIFVKKKIFLKFLDYVRFLSALLYIFLLELGLPEIVPVHFLMKIL